MYKSHISYEIYELIEKTDFLDRIKLKNNKKRGHQYGFFLYPE